MRRGEWRGAEREPEAAGLKGEGSPSCPDLAPQDGASSDKEPGKGEEVLLDIRVGGHIS